MIYRGRRPAQFRQVQQRGKAPERAMRGAGEPDRNGTGQTGCAASAPMACPTRRREGYTLLLDVRQALASLFVDYISKPAECISITLPWPPSVNHTWIVRGRRVVVQEAVTIYRMKVLSIVKTARMKKLIHSKTISSPVAVMLECCKPDKRKRDIDNIEKQIYDSLTKAKVWKDDSQVQVVLKYFGKNVKGGKVHVLIMPLEV